jgi:hypothetical protein
MRIRTLAPATLLLLGCGLDGDIEDRVTIEQGVYGQLTTYNDTAPILATTYLSWPVRVYSAPRGTSEPLATTESDERGFYEVALAPGAYEVCVSDRQCHAFTLLAGQRLRLDYQSPFDRWQEGCILCRQEGD